MLSGNSPYIIVSRLGAVLVNSTPKRFPVAFTRSRFMMRTAFSGNKALS